jgi:hypothetical protein
LARVREGLLRHDRRRITSRVGAFLFLDRRIRRAARDRVSGGRSGHRDGLGLGDVAIQPSSTYMIRSSLGVDEVSRRLSDGERARPRANGEVPDWFLPAVTAVARHII